jgi:cobalt-zinc-cadmium resistance protein CzcA
MINGMVNHNKQDDVVQGIVLLIKDKNITEVINGVKEKIDYLNYHGLPSDVRIVPIYDRTDLVQKNIHTVEHYMLEGIALILVIFFIFLRRIVALLVIIIVIPLCLCYLLLFSLISLMSLPI